ncbi:hypothetical protein PIB30_005821 [Stylosanthes scabra]|uniref:Uncharacterized protein n=1 Tax=Stylosanthes scabra TaxID=79078 RepID=A0ABU6Y2R0_9FABA|nr:hypothetical protein [Stylosanthes scabra]
MMRESTSMEVVDPACTGRNVARPRKRLVDEVDLGNKHGKGTIEARHLAFNTIMGTFSAYKYPSSKAGSPRLVSLNIHQLYSL